MSHLCVKKVNYLLVGDSCGVEAEAEDVPPLRCRRPPRWVRFFFVVGEEGFPVSDLSRAISGVESAVGDEAAFPDSVFLVSTAEPVVDLLEARPLPWRRSEVLPCPFFPPRRAPRLLLRLLPPLL